MTDRAEPGRERVEEIRRHWADDLEALKRKPHLVDTGACDDPDSWREVTMIRDLLARIAELERERDWLSETVQASENLRGEADKREARTATALAIQQQRVTELETLVSVANRCIPPDERMPDGAMAYVSSLEKKLSQAEQRLIETAIRRAAAPAAEAADRMGANQSLVEDNARLTDELAQAEQRVAELEAALRVAEEALDFAVGALGDAVDDMLDKPAGYAVIRMAKDALRLHVKPALTPPQPCGVRGCTLPASHDDEPHSWEHPTDDAPQPAPREGDAP